jgi:hypothetical protein
MKTIIFVFLFSLLSITSAHSLTGNKWLSQCETKSENVANWSFEYGICVGYLDALRTVNTVINNTGIYFKKDDYYYPYDKFCLPNKVELRQLIKIVTKWLNEHPEKLHKALDELYVDVMRETFPCKTQ